jgi:hypothetical protein
LPAGEKLRFLFEQILQKLDCITEVAQLDRSDGPEPVTPKQVTQILFSPDSHAQAT